MVAVAGAAEAASSLGGTSNGDDAPVSEAMIDTHE